jgi:sugar lactone lactonase YvrE
MTRSRSRHLGSRRSGAAQGRRQIRDTGTFRRHGPGGSNYVDSHAVDQAGRIHFATIPGRILVVEDRGRIVETIDVDFPFTTNVAFGGESMSTAFATPSSTGRLIAYECEIPGLPGMNSDHRRSG